MVKNGNISFKFGDIETTRYYAEILKFDFDNEIMSEHFGNYRSLSIEGCRAQFFPNPNNMKVNKKTSAIHFHSHLFDASKKN